MMQIGTNMCITDVLHREALTRCGTASTSLAGQLTGRSTAQTLRTAVSAASRPLCACLQLTQPCDSTTCPACGALQLTGAAHRVPVPLPTLPGRPPPDGRVHSVGNHEESVYGERR